MKRLIYCIFEGPPNRGWQLPPGVDGERVSFLESDGLCAVASPIDPSADDPGALVPRLLAYEAVIEKVHQERAVLPFRYGCVMESETQALEMLGSRCESCKSALRGLRGCVEMGVRVFVENACGPASPARFAANAGRPESGKSYLHSRQRHYDELDQRVKQGAEDADRFCHAFVGLFVKCKSEWTASRNGPSGPRMLSLYFLAHRDRVDDFRHAFEKLTRTEPAKMALTGPWPPYNFAEWNPQGERQ